MSETVQSLIDELSKYDPEATVLIEVPAQPDESFEQSGHIDEISKVGDYVTLYSTLGGS